MIQAQIAQNEMWNIIIQVVGLLASMASLVLAVVAIWLSFKFYTMSIHSSEKIEEANRAIGASVDRLEKVFQMQYSDTFSMVRDTYSDFRKHLMPETAAVAQAERLVENNADEKVEELRSEIRSELTRIVDRVGQTDAQLSSVKEQLEGVVDKAIVRSRKVDHEAREETLKAVVSSYVENVPFGIKQAMDTVVGDPVFMKYSLRDLSWPSLNLATRE